MSYIEEGRDKDAPKPDSYSANSLLFNSSNSICSVNFALPALLSAASSAIRGSFLVMKTSSIKALSEGSDSGLGDEMACRKNIGRNTAHQLIILSRHEMEVIVTYTCSKLILYALWLLP